MRVLLVEDEELLAIYLSDVLHEAGAIVVGPARTLHAALALADDEQLSAAVLDIHLGASTSLAVADKLARRRIPFLFQTSDPTFPRGAHTGAPVLRKPYLGEELIGAVLQLTSFNGEGVAEGHVGGGRDATLDEHSIR